MMKSLCAALVLAAVTSAASAQAPTCCAANGAEWGKVGGNYGNQNYSTLAGITRGNVGKLGGAWRLQIEGGDLGSFQQGNVVEAGGVIYAETTQGSVVAVDGKTGAVKWRYKAGGTMLRRGVALGEGKVFTTRAGRRAVALDQQTGAVVWDVAVSDETTIGSLPTAITYYDGMIFFGSADGQRGAVFALNAATGAQVWKVYGAAGAGEAGNETWAGESWKVGGAAPWQHPAVDPELGLIYFTFGNARAGGPLDGSTRAGQNLYANSIVAMDAKTGKRVWHFQSVHHDIWDMDNVMAPVLADVTIGGAPRKAVIYGSKTAMLYILDRATGAALHPIEERAVPQDPRQNTWPTQPYTKNETLVELCPTNKGAGRVPPNYSVGCLYTPHWDDPVVRFPGTGGGADTSPYSYSQKTGMLYVGVGVVASAAQRQGVNVGFRPLGQERAGYVVAYDVARGRVAWKRPMEWSLAHGNGVLSTAGDVLFIGQPDGYLLALDPRNGRELWRFQTGAGVHTSPITYQIDGEQYVAVLSGGNGLPYNSPKGDNLWAFKIGGTVASAAMPTPPSKRQPIVNAAVEGSLVGNHVILGRVWTNGKPGETESIAQNAMSPQVMTVPVGATVTFYNPPENTRERCATQFFEGLFNARLKPGEKFEYNFKKAGEYYFNDCAYPGTTGKIVVQ